MCPKKRTSVNNKSHQCPHTQIHHQQLGIHITNKVFTTNSSMRTEKLKTEQRNISTILIPFNFRLNGQLSDNLLRKRGELFSMVHRRTAKGIEKRIIHYRRQEIKEYGLYEFVERHPEFSLKSWRIEPKYKPQHHSKMVYLIGKCSICEYSNMEALEIHHLDGNHNNNSWSNIVVLCANCHTLITKKAMDYWFALSQKEKKIGDVTKNIKIEHPKLEMEN